jgi:hypothetical protein
MIAIEQSAAVCNTRATFAFQAGNMQALAEDASAFGRRWASEKDQLLSIEGILHDDDRATISRRVGFLKTQFMHASPRVDRKADAICKQFGDEYANDMASLFGRISSVKKLFQNGVGSEDLRKIYQSLPNSATVDFMLGKLEHRVRSLGWISRTILQEEGNFNANPTKLNEFKVEYYKARMKEAEVSCYNLAKCLFSRAPKHSNIILDMFGNCEQVMCAYNRSI